MGIADRDYIRRPAREFGPAGVASAVTWVIVVNFVVLVADEVMGRSGVGRPGTRPPPRMVRGQEGELIRWYVDASMPPLARLGHFSVERAIGRGEAWRFLTFQFLHADLVHVFVNMLVLFFFAPLVEARPGAWRFLGFYLLCGAAGAVALVPLSWAGVLHAHPAMPMVGASAGVFGVLVAAAFLEPQRQVPLLLMPGRAPLWILTVAAMLLAATATFRGLRNAGGEAAHLGGGLLALAIMLLRYRIDPFGFGGGGGRGGRRRRGFQKDWSKDFNR